MLFAFAHLPTRHKKKKYHRPLVAAEVDTYLAQEDSGDIGQTKYEHSKNMRAGTAHGVAWAAGVWVGSGFVVSRLRFSGVV